MAYLSVSMPDFLLGFSIGISHGGYDFCILAPPVSREGETTHYFSVGFNAHAGKFYSCHFYLYPATASAKTSADTADLVVALEWQNA